MRCLSIFVLLVLLVSFAVAELDVEGEIVKQLLTRGTLKDADFWKRLEMQGCVCNANAKFCCGEGR
uniref:Conotoxin Cal16.1 n=1 Tax=Californiconus californicus TaxID=1736779 RepID=CUGA_CONCL|nr:RecName: Full=Conotoxin Cal16.1; AltName: Full=Conotoxin Cal16a; Flags: Precursor [Californiconus californicus]ADB65788.1 conotoxin Cal 16 precursor [Californiconus californicus]